MDSLKDKVIIITGASSGIGRETSKLLANEGAKIILAARNQFKLKELKEEIEEQGGKAIISVTDVSKKEDLKNMVNSAIDTYGHVDVLINNAGIMPLSLAKNAKVDEWEKTIDINLKGTLLGTGMIIPHFVERQQGHIINMCSIMGRKTMRGAAAYCATKFGIQAFTDILRMELTPTENIRITSIEPGGVNTNIDESITDTDMKKVTDGTRDRGLLEPIDIAKAVHYALLQPSRVNIAEVLVMPSAEVKF